MPKNTRFNSLLAIWGFTSMNDVLNNINKELCMQLMSISILAALIFRVFGIPVELFIGLIAEERDAVTVNGTGTSIVIEEIR